MRRRVLGNTYLLWAVLALPAIWFVAERFALHGKVAFVPWTGILSGWLMIVTLMVTPLQQLFGPLPWLKKHRRHLGVASFGYAFLHFFFWLINENLRAFIQSFLQLDILVGWIAFFILIALAMTSNDASVGKLGTGWKRLQRWVYPAAILTYIHWLMTTDYVVDAVLYAAPLIALTIWRVLRHRKRPRGV
ncbi:MAG TPA: ferric reductase-like transmembrane domain-containing protein [Albidovulum sp.]|uniref:sulfite oxidase heme-binding subunit YedZ n=1 Tax=Albidovulum sp. TaxID=1872424 RepID=UPI002C62CE62|nr:ferric reductase-like transmembrane domain-containing protein [Albidovulum sp.]